MRHRGTAGAWQRRLRAPRGERLGARTTPDTLGARTGVPPLSVTLAASSLPVPADPRARIWRYMNFAKFVSLIDAQALFFAYVDRFRDTREGGREDTGPVRVAASSWHLSEHESEAMWRLYSPREEAVAVQSTYERLRAALPARVRLHLVTYVDDPDRIAGADRVDRFFYKRKAYEHEKELRAVLPIERTAGADRARETEGGWLLPIDPDAVIERVYVSPFAADWFREVVVGASRRYGQRFPVERSALAGTV